VLDLVLAARADNPTNSRLRRVAEQIGVALRVDGGEFEAVLVAQSGFQFTDPWRDQMSRCEPAVFRIELEMPDGAVLGIGTGFLVGPAAAMTCNHVFTMNGIEPDSNWRDRLRARFDYKADADGKPIREGTVYRMAQASDWMADRSPVENLDYALIRLEGTPGQDPIGSSQSPERGWLSAVPYSFAVDETLAVLQHPAGRPLSLSLGPVKRSEADRIWHKANTEPGSSGAPCFNARWQVGAMHHHGSETAGLNRAVPAGAIRAAVAAGPGASLLASPAQGGH